MSRIDDLVNGIYPLEDSNDSNTICKRVGFRQGYEQASKDYIEYAQLWVDSGEVNIKSFKQFLKDRGYE